MKLKLLLFLFILTIVGAFLRFYKITENPVSLTVDEVSIGYNAYSILNTGKDEYGFSFPLTFKSLGDYKPPLYIYLTAIPIAIFGLNELSVRFISAFLGTLAIPLSFLLFYEITKNRKYSIVGALILTISPWHIYFSRFGSESLTASVFVMVGIWCFLRMLRGNRFYILGAAIFLVASIYTYHAEKIFVPMFLGLLLFLNRSTFLLRKKTLISFVVLTGILLLPFVYTVIFGQGTARAQMTIISNDVEFLRHVVLDSFGKNIVDPLLLLFYGIRKYLAYFQPSFLFYNGLGMTKLGTYGLGVMYLFEIPFLIYGIISLVRKKILNRYLILLWIALGIFPAALTLNEQHSIRTLVILPMLVLVSSIGAVEIVSIIQKSLPIFKRVFTYSVFSIFIVWNLFNALTIFSVHFPKQKGEGLMEGTKQAVEFIKQNEDKYKEIVFDPVRGVEGPYLVNAPHAYILFFLNYDPVKYHSLEKIEGENSYSFDKFTVRSIKWIDDSNKEDTLFIGSPWSIPENQLSSDQILKNIYLSNGKLAFLIVTSKKKLKTRE